MCKCTKLREAREHAYVTFQKIYMQNIGTFQAELGRVQRIVGSLVPDKSTTI